MFAQSRTVSEGWKRGSIQGKSMGFAPLSVLPAWHVRTYWVREHVLCTVKSSPPPIPTMSQSLKTENVPDMASALVELRLKGETDNK